ncbi:MAG: DUF411 domain-containing protein [Balneolaceae bacterium]|nr:DUF411 domain-containing protein [Balneolaceae bacterium]MCH8547697.1 DUF411 domain-containing protein [Balneolaceae bacterium]
MNSRLFYAVIALLLVSSIVFWYNMFQEPTERMSEAEQYEGEITLTMYHGEGCMCCVRWAEYLEENGVTVIDKLVENPHEIKREKGVPGQLSSCHTGIVDGYVVEGHVPVEDIRRLLAERPDAIGISVPGMPPSAPGMDAPVSREYQTVLFSHDQMSVYAVHE